MVALVLKCRAQTVPFSPLDAGLGPHRSCPVLAMTLVSQHPVSEELPSSGGLLLPVARWWILQRAPHHQGMQLITQNQYGTYIQQKQGHYFHMQRLLLKPEL